MYQMLHYVSRVSLADIIYGAYVDIKKFIILWVHGLVVKALDSQFKVNAKVDLAFHLTKVNQMNTRNFWELSGKK